MNKTKKQKNIKNINIKIFLIILLSFFLIKNIFFTSLIHCYPNYQPYSLKEGENIKKIARYKNNANNINKQKDKIYEYSNFNNEIKLYKKKILNSNNEIEKTFEYIYDENNRIVKKKEIKKNSSNIETFQYNEKNQLVSIKNSKDQFKIKYKYDQQGKLKSQKKFYLHDKTSFYIEKYIYEYNDKNQIINKKLYSKMTQNKNGIQFSIFNFKINLFKFKNKKIDKIICEYKYNDSNNKIQKLKKKKIFLDQFPNEDESFSLNYVDVYDYVYVDFNEFNFY